MSTDTNGEVWASPCRDWPRRACGRLPSAGRARPVYQRAGGARSGKPLGMLRVEGGRAVHHPMTRGALSRRPSDRRRQKEPRDMCRAASFLPSSGGCPCLGRCTPSSVIDCFAIFVRFAEIEHLFDKIVPFIGLLCERSEQRPPAGRATSERSQAGGGPGTECTVLRSAVRAQVAVTSRSLTASRRDTHVPTASRRNSDRVSRAWHLLLSRASWASSRRDTSHGIQTSSRSASIAGCCRRRAPGIAARIRTRQTSMPV